MKSPDEIRRETEAIVRTERRRQADLRALDRMMEQLATGSGPRPQPDRPSLALVPDEE
jgi:hypothetical protein